MKLFGIDVSIYQGVIDWKAVASQAAFVFVRASDGEHGDTHFDANWKGAKNAGIVRGAYQFVRASQSPEKQVALLDSMIRSAGGLEATDLPPVIDIELSDGVDPEHVQKCVTDWVFAAEAILGRRPIVYTGPAFATVNHLEKADIASLPLWVAHYTSRMEPTVPRPWENWTFWQVNCTTRLAGIRGTVDGNWFQGSEADLQALIAESARPMEPVTEA